MLSKNDKVQIIKKYQQSKNDTGSSVVQVSILTSTIKYLTEHLKIHKKDIVAKRSLLKKVSQRKRLLSYLNKKDHEKYKDIVKKLSLRK